jgi:hypothetical protein
MSNSIKVGEPSDYAEEQEDGSRVLRVKVDEDAEQIDTRQLLCDILDEIKLTNKLLRKIYA